MVATEEGTGSEELVAWLIEQIEASTLSSRLDFIGECIALDKEAGESYTKSEISVRKLRKAWSKQKQIITADSLPSVQGESTD